MPVTERSSPWQPLRGRGASCEGWRLPPRCFWRPRFFWPPSPRLGPGSAFVDTWRLSPGPAVRRVFFRLHLWLHNDAQPRLESRGGKGTRGGLAGGRRPDRRVGGDGLARRRKPLRPHGRASSPSASGRRPGRRAGCAYAHDFSRVNLDWISFTAGRQVVNYGRGALWSPTDIFTELDLAGISPVRRGTDALRVAAPSG